MREIKFRGKTVDNGNCVYGYYWFDNQNKKHKITSDLSDDNFRCYEVTHESIGQFTGLIDKNGKEIYEGDIDINGDVVHWCNNKVGYAMCVYETPEFKNKVFCHCLCCEGNFEIIDEKLEIICTIHD